MVCLITLLRLAHGGRRRWLVATRITSAEVQIAQTCVRAMSLAPRKPQSALCIVADRSRRPLRAPHYFHRDTASLDIPQLLPTSTAQTASTIGLIATQPSPTYRKLRFGCWTATFGSSSRATAPSPELLGSSLAKG